VPAAPQSRAIRAHAAKIVQTAAALRRRGHVAEAEEFEALAYRTRESSLVSGTGDEFVGLAHRAHADGQMAAARLTTWEQVRSDCVACARMWRRVSRAFLRGRQD